jgi:hypothetical protein
VRSNNHLIQPLLLQLPQLKILVDESFGFDLSVYTSSFFLISGVIKTAWKQLFVPSRSTDKILDSALMTHNLCIANGPDKPVDPIDILPRLKTRESHGTAPPSWDITVCSPPPLSEVGSLGRGHEDRLRAVPPSRYSYAHPKGVQTRSYVDSAQGGCSPPRSHQH